jgi:hypothetical protein
MSVVLRGYGLGDIDSGSSVVAFGLVRDLDAGETIETAIADASIAQLFVIDFDGRRKMTAAEYRKYRKLTAMMRMGQIQFQEKRNGIEYFIKPTRFRKAA